MSVNLIFKKSSIKNLALGKKQTGGRNNTGRITSYHKGGACKRKIRLIDYNRFLWNIFGLVKRIEYDPQRNSLIALIIYSNGILSYIIATEGLQVGDLVYSGERVVFKTGNSTLLEKLFVGARISNIEIRPKLGAKFIRSAGAYGTIISIHINSVVVKLKSNEIRRFASDCVATLGGVSNFQFMFRNFRKAGYYRLRGWRPVVRGVAMNPVDHPHGGGQGKTSGGRPSVTPWGVITKGKPTRRKVSPFVIKLRK